MGVSSPRGFKTQPSPCFQGLSHPEGDSYTQTGRRLAAWQSWDLRPSLTKSLRTLSRAPAPQTTVVAGWGASTVFQATP